MNADRLRAIGRKGGLIRNALRGNPGTPDGRRKGGLHSIPTHIKNKSGFKVLKPITTPRNSARLAELIGIFMGDGHVGPYQATVVTNSETDFNHALFIKALIEDLFKVTVSLRTRKEKKSCELIISSKSVCDFLVNQGIPKGNKIKLGMHIPEWIRTNTLYRKAFIRGLFDTDGCVYVDTHVYKQKIYKNLGMAFANQSLPLLYMFKESLESFGLNPTQKTEFRVFLRRREDIERYFDLVGSSNEKHFNKVHQHFLSLQKGGVA
ncbi:MAG: LAGLIDADG family homing endonuclease [Minisyncoccota bacterium]